MSLAIQILLASIELAEEIGDLDLAEQLRKDLRSIVGELIDTELND